MAAVAVVRQLLLAMDLTEIGRSLVNRYFSLLRAGLDCCGTPHSLRFIASGRTGNLYIRFR